MSSTPSWYDIEHAGGFVPLVGEQLLAEREGHGGHTPLVGIHRRPADPSIPASVPLDPERVEPRGAGLHRRAHREAQPPPARFEPFRLRAGQ